MRKEPDTLKFAVIIPTFNEEKYLQLCLDSLVNQSLQPKYIIVVDDSSTDNTSAIIKKYEDSNENISYIYNSSESTHQPGSKVIRAFYKGLGSINLSDIDIICKFDADLIFPVNYIEELNNSFTHNKKLGLCGGRCSILKNGIWQIESLTNNDHIRGALKAYRKTAFKDINGLAQQMGWDTADEIKLRYNNWQIEANLELEVKHLKPTGNTYSKSYYDKQGKVFYALRYGFLLMCVAAIKMGLKRDSLKGIFKIITSYLTSNGTNYLLTFDEGKYLRKYRWQQIKKKFSL